MLGASKGERNGMYPDAELAGYEEESRGFSRGEEDNALPLRRIKAERRYCGNGEIICLQMI